MNGWAEKLRRIFDSHRNLFQQWVKARKTIVEFSPESEAMSYSVTQTLDDSVDLVVLCRHVRVRFYTESSKQGLIAYSHVTIKDGHEVEHKIGKLGVDDLGNVEGKHTVDDPEWHAAVLAAWLDAHRS